ncbi:MAG: trypsin-like peptidase domain-containing protein [Planctomycetes bacterium]|nr:trypsin-like peptidase domain-containing protein [Planctomycetota bacterium]
MNRIRWYGPTVVLALTVLVVMIAGPGLVRHLVWAQRDARITLVKDDLKGNQTLAELSKSFRSVGEVVEPSVVYIQVSKKAQPRPERERLSPEDMWRWRFGPGAPNMPGMPDEGEGNDDHESPDDQPGDKPGDMDKYNVPQVFASGSGWVYDSKGHIITNNHVIAEADVITVRFHDGGERQAKLVGSDPKTDIAVIQIDDGDLHPATIAKEPVEQGDIVFAFGSPFRFEFSMSQGIVSAKGRQLGIIRDRSGLEGYENFIQTDAAINPGNSGGPLTNIYGQVIGMNTAIASRTGAYNGLGFAIPADMITDVVDQILKNGRVTRGYLGVFIEDLEPKMAKTFGFAGKGVLVRSPIKDGPAEKAGLKPGDIITKVDGKAVSTAEQLRRTVAGYAPGAKVPLDVFREGKTLTMDLVVAEMPAEVARAGSVKPEPATQPEDVAAELMHKLGIDSAVTFTADVAARLRIPFHAGVLVRTVRPGSSADAAGLSRGQVITDVMGVTVKTIQEFGTELKKHDLSKGVRISVIEGGVPRFLLLEMTAK